MSLALTVFTAAIGLLAIALVIGRHYHHSARLLEWRDVLDPSSERILSGMRARVAIDDASLEDAIASALRARERSAMDEAVRLLNLASAVVVAATPYRMQRLRGMARATRQAAALVPMPAISPTQLRLTGPRTIARLAQVLHAILVAPAERFLLRLRVIAVGFWASARVLSRASAAPVAALTAERLWARLDAARSDFQALDAELLASYRVLLQSLTADLRDTVTVR